MINRAHRFRGQKDIQNIYRRGRTIRLAKLSAKILPAKTSTARLAVVVSKKVNKSAVIRNRIRRRLYQQFRLLLDAKTTIKSDIVLSVYDDRLATAPPKDIKDIIRQLSQEIEKTSQNRPK